MRCGGNIVHKLRRIDQVKNFGGILVHGCFDVVHYGHMRMFRTARQLMPHAPLTVSITADEFIMKGKGRPIFDQYFRAEFLCGIEFIDYVVVVDAPDALPVIRMVQPRYYVKGKEYEFAAGIAYEEKQLAEQLGATMVYTERWFSTTDVVRKLNEVAG